jgi:hypothetical protein
MTHRISISFILAVILLMSPSMIHAEQSKEEKAIEQAEKWLVAVDMEKYGESWERAAAFFKNAVTRDQWLASMNAYRKPLGKIVERKLESSRYMTSLPGAPDGEYVVIQFSTTFENKKTAIETVTPMMDPDGLWKVAGYFIK